MSSSSRCASRVEAQAQAQAQAQAGRRRLLATSLVLWKLLPRRPVSAAGTGLLLSLPMSKSLAQAPQPAQADRPPAAPADGPSSAATGVPAEVRGTVPEARLVGEGALRFFGLMVYQARLWAAPDFALAQYDKHPFALELTYARRLEGPAIAERSVAEMRRVDRFSDEQAQRWQAAMVQAFPDVVAQDRLLGVYDGRRLVRFFHNGRPTAQVSDPLYARLFFGIWLSPRTSAPALRDALAGVPAR